MQAGFVCSLTDDLADVFATFPFSTGVHQLNQYLSIYEDMVRYLTHKVCHLLIWIGQMKLKIGFPMEDFGDDRTHSTMIAMSTLP